MNVLTGSYGETMFSSVRNCQLSFKVAVPFSIPTRKARVPAAPYPLLWLLVVSFMGFGHYNKFIVVSHCCFNLKFPNDVILNIFSYASYLHIFLERCLFSFLPILNLLHVAAETINIKHFYYFLIGLVTLVKLESSMSRFVGFFNLFFYMLSRFLKYVYSCPS